MKLSAVDLNLFVLFEAVYATRSATRAGERLGLTQSAVSAGLKRMRERFGDPLFVRTTDGMAPTALAERLIDPVAEALARLQQAVDQGPDFDPATSSRTLRIAINDIGQLVLVSRLLAEARRRAPALRLETVDVAAVEARQKLQHGQVDILVGSWPPLGPSFYQQRLFDESFVVLMRSAHALSDALALTLDNYLSADHLAYRPQGATETALEQTLDRVGVLDRRRVVLSAAHLAGLSSLVASTDLLLTVPCRLGKLFAIARPDLVIRPVPFVVMPFDIRQQWHERYHHDGGSRWLRRLIFELFYEPSALASSTPHRGGLRHHRQRSPDDREFGGLPPEEASGI